VSWDIIRGGLYKAIRFSKAGDKNIENLFAARWSDWRLSVRKTGVDFFWKKQEAALIAERRNQQTSI